MRLASAIGVRTSRCAPANHTTQAISTASSASPVWTVKTGTEMSARFVAPTSEPLTIWLKWHIANLLRISAIAALIIPPPAGGVKAKGLAAWLPGVVVRHIADPPPSWRSSQPEPCDLARLEAQE